MGNLYPYVEAAVMAACLAVPVFAAAVVAQRRGVGPAMLWAAVGVGWFLLVWELARAGAFEGTRHSGRFAEVAFIVAPLLVGALLLRLGHLTTGAASLVAIQACRVVAVVVLVAFAGEALPGWLALPIGVGDTSLGLAALPMAGWLRAGASGRGIVRAWNGIGAALTIYTMAAPIASAHSTGYFFSLYPLVLFPTFLAPGALVLHFLTARALAGRTGW